MTSMEIFRLAGLLLWLSLTVFTEAFVVPNNHQRALASSGSLQMAGFGASSKKGKSNQKDRSSTTAKKKIKPRQQWDNFISDDLKTSDSVRVAVRVVSSSSPDNWFEAGAIKSKDNAYTEASVIRHRMLIADHAKRLYPLQILPNDKLEWGYSYSKSDIEESDSVCEWKIAGKVEVMPDDIDKMIGFKGLPDPSGFYSSSQTSAAVGSGRAPSDYLNMKNKAISVVNRLEVHD